MDLYICIQSCIQELDQCIDYFPKQAHLCSCPICIFPHPSKQVATLLSLSLLISFACLGVSYSGIILSYVWCLSLSVCLWYISTLFSKVIVPGFTPIGNVWEFQFLLSIHPCQCLALAVHLIIVILMSEMVPYYGFRLHFPDE